MFNFFLEDFFRDKIFFPFLVICFCLGIVSIILIILHYLFRRIDEINQKARSINEAFLSIKDFYKKKFIALDDILTELKKVKNLYGSYEEESIKRIDAERYRLQKKLEKIDPSGRDPNSIQSLLKLTNQLENLIQQILTITTKYPDIKTYSKFLTRYSNYKIIEDRIDSSINLYNRKVKEFNFFIIQFPYIIFAIIFNVQPRKFF